MRSLLAISLAVAAAACSSPEGTTESASASASAPVSASAAPPAPPGPASTLHASVREGGALARGVGEEALYVADEDHRAVRRVPLPATDAAAVRSLELPGAPAQVLPLGGRVLVTVRDPGLLVALAADAQGALRESARVALPADAWGVAVSPDEKVALVTSAWTRKVSAVDLETMSLLWSIEVAQREPRGVAIASDGKSAWITHLVGASLTKLEPAGDWRSAPKARPVLLPAAPLRSPAGVTLSASLGYAAIFSPDGARLFVARHALGALGENAWFGASTVDVLAVASDSPIAPRRHDKLPFHRADKGREGAELVVPPPPLSLFTQPRALAWRASTGTLLVASEGDDRVVELDASALDPSLAAVARYPTGGAYDAGLPVAGSGGAPTGIALSADEQTAYVWCRSTYDLATVPLLAFPKDGTPKNDAAAEAPATLRLASDTLSDDAALGRRLFYNATDRVTSGGLGCAGCHPDGRDDGHVWHEGKFNTTDGTHTNFVGHQADIPPEEAVKGAPRRTPMLAGMVDAAGPYGWHGESADLATRLGAGFGLHRWGGMPAHEAGNVTARTARIAAFVRTGLVPPPKVERELDATEKRGRELFLSDEVGCASCHVPDSGYTNRVVYPLNKLPTLAAFDDEESAAFKTPSLRGIAGRAPYFHDGRAPTLEWIVDNNTGDRMGKTNHLSGVDRAALVAFLRTL